ncbi:unnamed protein product [Pieris brassicae]|uniref:Uncharacterized protein n=1 Tax=Pieris brassicae TaxID=7116 RepID=A0A9P0TMP2_PIEBR|nr:unnamed protein product [Pieris brassicae]
MGPFVSEIAFPQRKTLHNENEASDTTRFPNHFRPPSAFVGYLRARQLTGPMSERDATRQPAHAQERRRTAHYAAAAI